MQDLFYRVKVCDYFSVEVSTRVTAFIRPQTKFRTWIDRQNPS